MRRTTVFVGITSPVQYLIQKFTDNGVNLSYGSGALMSQVISSGHLCGCKANLNGCSVWPMNPNGSCCYFVEMPLLLREKYMKNEKAKIVFFHISATMVSVGRIHCLSSLHRSQGGFDQVHVVRSQWTWEEKLAENGICNHHE